MTDIKLLPLPKKAQLANPYASRGVPTYGHSDETLTDYARANVAHATEPLKAEIDALREEVERLKQMLGECYVEAGADTDGNEPSRLYAQALSAVQDLRRDYDETLAEPDYKARAERLAEALREARDAIEDWAGYASDYFREKHDLAGDLAKIDALLREQEEGHEQ